MDDIREAAVIGAGAMGAGIAAQFAAAGVTVTLLDISRTVAAEGVQKQIGAGGLCDDASIDRIRTGSIDDDLELIDSADWILEAVAEDIEIKREVYRRLQANRKAGSAVTSSTSTIQLAKLMEGSPALAADFLITHFFNPPRLMKLLEVVAGPLTRPGLVSWITDFSSARLGKSVILCADTPGFVANRLGNYWMACALNEALNRGIEVEDADSAIGAPFGAPAGIFAMLDYVGIDLLPSGWSSLQASLPESDPLHDYPSEPPIIARMIGLGLLGRKAGAGFMRRKPDGVFEALDLNTTTYRPMRRVTRGVSAGPNSLAGRDDAVGRYVSTVTEKTLAYASSLIPHVARSPAIIDQAMRDGYGWRRGPFEFAAFGNRE